MVGGGSYVLSLPKEWIRMANIKKNDSLGVFLQPDGTLSISPRLSEEKHIQMKNFDVDAIKDPRFLFRCLIGTYIVGCTTIIITSSARLSPAVRKIVRDFTQMTIGQEIVEETDTMIVLKDLLNPIEMPFNNSIKRMYVIIKTIFQDAILALQTKNRSLFEDIINRDNEVDRLQWLISRQYNLLLKDLDLSKKMGVPVNKALIYLIISRLLERIADHGVRIAHHAPTLIDHRIDVKIIDDLKSATEIAIHILDSSMQAFFSGNLRKANITIESVEKLEMVSDAINALALQKRGAIALSVGYITESIRRTGEYGADISETVINELIEESSE